MRQSREPTWYVRDYIAGHPRQVWLFTDQTATNMSVANPENGPGTFFKAEPDEDIWDCLDRLTGWLKPGVTEGHFHKMTLGPAQFHPRIARPLALGVEPTLWSPTLDVERAYVAGARGQLTLLVRKLELICRTVQPCNRTLHVYGHEIRNLLILAATEAEMHWRGILKANGSQVAKPNSNQYVKLIEPLKLLDYEVVFHDFPDIAPVRPFAGWLATAPTNSLGWYAAYNGVKHNREEEFERGTLQDAFAAVSACLSLLVAQFGPVALGAELASYVTVSPPSWPIPDMYIPRMTEADWTPMPHQSLAEHGV